MRTVLLLLLAVLTVSLLFVTCIKEYSYEGGAFAVFTIEGSPSTCSPLTISGNYTTSVTLDSNNYATVTADVTEAGKYTIATNTADGISFSASGIFTDTGKQVVYLQATGTPATDGVFDFTIPGTTGCSFSLVVEKQAAASYYLSGSPTDCSNPNIQGDYTQYTNLIDKNTIELAVHVNTPGTYDIHTDVIAGIKFSATGYFSDTGDKTVTLAGIGTPDTTGLFYFNVFADSSQCSFSVPITPTFPLGVYVLEYDQDTTCYQYTINGDYKAGIPLNNTNTITFKVYASEVGNYSIYTKKINGIMFGTAGKFTQTGEQLITLQGMGTAVESGDFIFTPRIVGPSPKGGDFCNLHLHVQ